MSSPHPVPARFLSCDWGTTRLRLRLVERANDAILAEHCSDAGVARLAGTAPDDRPAAFRQALSYGLAQIAAQHGDDVRNLAIVVSGMASSSIGWHELPYAALPLALDGSGLVWKSLGPLDADHAGQVVLVSGLASGEDVMRGEEIEVLGAARLMSDGPLAGEAVLILPGTHSKHVRVRAGHIIGFQTFMTGELFEVLSAHSVLRHSVLQRSGEPAALQDTSTTTRVATSAAFDEGVRLSATLPLAAALFQVRTRALLARWSPADCSQFLSGILIAAEFVGLQQPTAASLPIVLAVPPALSESYARAAIALGFSDRLTVLPPAEVARLAVIGQSLVLERFLAA
jgi:2-dehydro-3-deoxygalactonokinase